MSYLYISIQDEDNNAVEYKVTEEVGVTINKLLTIIHDGVLDVRMYGKLATEGADE